jgi:peptidoglycan/xylan/chitin deacetylase (PgdA/CDA1 family)
MTKGSLRHGARRSCLAAAAYLSCATGVTAIVDRLLGGHGCFLMFHRVARHEDWHGQPNRGFYLDAEFLDSLLTRLRRRGWALLSVGEALEALSKGVCGRFVNFSIDDGYRDTFELALPLFRGQNAPITLYLTSGIPDGTFTLWGAGMESILREMDRVVLPGQNGPTVIAIPDHRSKRKLFQRLHAQWESEDPISLYQNFCAANGYSPDELNVQHAADWEMIRSVRQDRNVEFASHTMSHRRASRLSNTEVLQELLGSRLRLEQQLHMHVRHLAFPFGRPEDCGERDFQLARQAGYSTVATTVHGVIRTKEAMPFVLPRNSLNGEIQRMAMINAHLAGLSGLIERQATSSTHRAHIVRPGIRSAGAEPHQVRSNESDNGMSTPLSHVGSKCFPTEGRAGTAVCRVTAGEVARSLTGPEALPPAALKRETDAPPKLF